jgi:hypothetical protein
MEARALKVTVRIEESEWGQWSTVLCIGPIMQQHSIPLEPFPHLMVIMRMDLSTKQGTSEGNGSSSVARRLRLWR